MAAAAPARRLPRVAVIVPCYNDGATLAETISSLEDQEAHELVVVDDGSTDEATLALLDDLRAGGVAVVRQANAGLSAARMAGVAATGAPYVQPLDADDLLEPGALAALADALDAHPDAAAAWGDIAVFGEFRMIARTADRLDPWLVWHMSEMPGTSMFRRTALEETGGWRFGEAYEDWDLWMALAERRFAGVRVPRVVLRYRRDPGRMNAGGLARHTELATSVRARHPSLRSQRLRNWLASPAPVRVRLLFPALEIVPGLSDWSRLRLKRLVAHPRRTVAYRRARLDSR
jgi:glycosyltransferase involved in cell wall biosynthesis